MKPTVKADLELVEECRAGNVLAYSTLVERHQRGLLRLCMRFVRDLEKAEDVVQETFVKAYQKLHMFEGRSSFKNWLYQIAVNTAKNKLRAMKVDSVSLENVELSIASEAAESLEMADIKSVIRKYIDTLPEKQRVALVLRTFEDLSFKEIAKIMDCPYDTAKANYRHAIVKLRKQLAENETLRDWQPAAASISIRNRYSEVDQ